MWDAQGELVRARAGLMRALELASGAGDKSMAVQAENMLGHVEYGAGDVHAARDRFVRSVEGFKALALPWGTRNALSGLAGATLATGDAEQAERLLEEATSVLRQAGPWFSSLALCVRRHPGGAAAILTRRSPWREKASLISASSTTSSLSCTPWSLSPPRPRSRATTLGRSGSWALGTPSPNAPVPPWSTSRCTTSMNNRNERCVHALAPDRWVRAYAAGRSASIDSLMKDIDTARR